MYLNILKFQTPAGQILTQNWRLYLDANLPEGWERNPNLWEGSWVGLPLITASNAKNWTVDLLNAIETAGKTGNLSFNPGKDVIKPGGYLTGYKDWNTAFNALGLNENYFGYDNADKKDTYLGPTTWTRHNYYEGLKLRHGNAQNAIKTNNGSIYWDTSSKRWVSVPNPTVTTGQPSGQTGTATGGQPTQLTGTPGQTGATEDPTQQRPGQPGDTDEEPTKKPLWTDWIPHTSQLATDLVASANKFKLATQRDVPLLSSYYEHYLTGDNYFQQLALKQLAAEVRARGNQNLTSDMNYNLRLRQAYEDKALELELRALEIKANAYNQSMREALAVANRNTERQVATANINREKMAAYRNYVNDAKQALNAEQAAAWKGYVGNMYTDLTQWNLTQQINDAYKREKLLLLDYTTKAGDLFNTYQTTWTNPETSDIYKEFAAYVADPKTGLAFGNQRPVDPESSDYKTWLRLQWDSDLGKTWRERWQKAKDDAYLSLGDLMKVLKLQMLAGDVNTPYYFPRSTTYVPTTTKPKEPPRIITNAKGGKVARLIDYTNSNLKQMQFSLKQQMEANKRNVDHLNRELDRLNRELIALLRAMFK